jgi:hypothetical protein
MAREIQRGDERYFGMFTDEGNVAVHRMVSDLAAAIGSGEIQDRDGFDERLETAMYAIDETGHSEVFDSDVRDHIADALTDPLERAAIDADDITAF